MATWDKDALATHNDAEQIDVTEQMIDLFNPSEQGRKYAIDVQKKKPIAEDVLRKMSASE